MAEGIINPIMPSLKEREEYMGYNNGVRNTQMIRNIQVDSEPVAEQLKFIKFVQDLKDNDEDISQQIEIQKSLEDKFSKLGYDYHKNLKAISEIGKTENGYTDEIIKTAREITGNSNHNNDIR